MQTLRDLRIIARAAVSVPCVRRCFVGAGAEHLYVKLPALDRFLGFFFDNRNDKTTDLALLEPLFKLPHGAIQIVGQVVIGGREHL